MHADLQTISSDSEKHFPPILKSLPNIEDEKGWISQASPKKSILDQERIMSTSTSSLNRHHGQTKSPLSTTDHAVVELIRALGKFLVQSNLVSVDERSWDYIDKILGSLPLSIADFGLSKQRLSNARGYVKCGELGAARYELGLLRRRFASQPI